MKSKKLLALLILIIAVGGSSGFLIAYFSFKWYLPVCENPLFTNYPADMDRITSIVPLGNLNPPGHSFPTDHMYFFTNTTQYPEGFEIFAPGNLILTRLIKVEYDPPQGLISEDYSIEFSVCRNVWGKFGHVNNLSTYLLEQVGGFGPEYGDEIYTYQIAGRNYTNYRKDVNLAITAGQLLGMAGQGGGYDFWLKDDRVELTWINQEWTREFQYTVCPLDYFNASLKSALQAKLKDWSGKPVYPPNYGGKIDFDVANTVQGIWTKEDFVNRAEDYGLALVYSNFNTSVGAISIGLAGNSSWDSRVYSFDPAEDGFENRVFNEVTSDGNVYYYFCNEFRSGMDYYKVILLKLTANRELRLQFIDNGGIPLPNDPRPLWNELNSIKYIR